MPHSHALHKKHTPSQHRTCTARCTTRPPATRRSIRPEQTPADALIQRTHQQCNLSPPQQLARHTQNTHITAWPVHTSTARHTRVFMPLRYDSSFAASLLHSLRLHHAVATQHPAAGSDASDRRTPSIINRKDYSIMTRTFSPSSHHEYYSLTT